MHYISTISKLEIEGGCLTLSATTRRHYGHATEVVVIDQQLGYIPIPKNGSTSIRQMLTLAGVPHTSIYDTANDPVKFFKQFDNIKLFTVIRRDSEQRLLSGINEYLTRTHQLFNDSMLLNLPLDEHSAYQASYLIGVDLTTVDILTLYNVEQYINNYLGIKLIMPRQNKSAANDIESLRQRIANLPNFTNYLEGEKSTVDSIIGFKLKPKPVTLGHQ